jgi:hypothetical protein
MLAMRRAGISPRRYLRETLRGLYTGDPWVLGNPSPIPPKEIAEQVMREYDASLLVLPMLALDAYNRPWLIGRVASLDGARASETLSKAWIYQGARERARNAKHVFWVCSKHNDCAKDHVAWQGKYYISEDWKRIADRKDWGEIEALVRIRNIRPMEWVEGAPAWLVTRPNCRHFMVSVPTETVAAMGADEACDSLGISFNVGPRDMRQTSGRTKDSAEEMIDFYADRLHLHQEMASYMPDDEIRQAIVKDRQLLRYWERQRISR